LFAVALATALARVAALETELKTTTEALKDANNAKVSADKAAKAAETKSKKAEKALAEATQKQAKSEQAVVEQLDAICMSIGSKCFILSLCLAKVTSIDMLLLAYLYFCDVANKLGEVWKLWQESAKDRLLDAVEVLESNWRLARDVLQRTRHVLTRMFVGLFPRKKDELPAGNLRKLVEAFDTIEDPVLAVTPRPTLGPKCYHTHTKRNLNPKFPYIFTRSHIKIFSSATSLQITTSISILKG
jgi:hypothetical protein